MRARAAAVLLALALSACGDKPAQEPAKPPMDPAMKAMDDANAALRRRDLPAARAALDALVALRPDDADARMLRCVTLEAASEFASALTDCDAAVRLKPERQDVLLDALCARGGARAGLGRRKEAAADLRQALSLAPRGWKRRAEIDRRLAELERKEKP